MSTEDSNTDLTSLPNVIVVSEVSSESSIAAAVRRNYSDSQELLISGGETPATEEMTSSLSPETTSSDISNSEDAPDAGTPESPSKAASSNVGASSEEIDPETIHEQTRKVCFASAVTEISASVASEDNVSALGDLSNVSAVAGTSTESAAPDATAGESENAIERSGDIANRGCCPEHRGFIGYFRISMMYLRESKYLLPFQFLLLSMPVSSGFMGSIYMEKCPVSSALPLLFFMMGILGTIVLCARIYSIFKKALFPHSDWSGQVQSALVAGLLLLTVLYITELACFWNVKPSFSHGNEDYCDETFYHFMCYMNYISIALVILLLLLHCPGTQLCAAIRTPHLVGELN